MSWINMILVDMLTWLDKIYEVLCLDKELQVNLESEDLERLFFLGQIIVIDQVI